MPMTDRSALGLASLLAVLMDRTNSKDTSMAPPTTALRLRDADPHTVALDTARQTLDHVTSLCISLSPIGEVRTPQIDRADLERCELYLSTRRLAQYAVHGGELDAPVQEYLISLIPCYSAAVGSGTAEIDGLVEAQPETALGLVIAAAVAREAMDNGKSVTPAQLAVLAGIDRQRVLQLITSGDMPGAKQEPDGRRGWTIAARSARKWLSIRG